MTSTAQGTGDPGSASGTSFEALARQYWNAWGEAMRHAGVPGADPAAAATAGVPDWQDAVEWWSKLAHGGREQANAAVERFNAQGRQWYGQMQQVAAQFAGQEAGAADIASAWKRALGAAGENPFPELFRAMRGQGQQGLEQWMEDASPYLDAWRRESSSWLGMPAFGLNREHQERLQALVQAQLDYQQRSGAYAALMAKSAQHAYALFEYKLGEREQPGRQLTSARALFDLWIDAAEEAYAQVALSREFREVYGALVNAQMRVRAGVQREIEQVSAMFGIPTRSELDGAHRKLAELERVVRRMRDAADVGARAANPQPRRSAAPSPRPRSAPQSAPAARARSRTRASGAQAVRPRPEGRGSQHPAPKPGSKASIGKFVSSKTKGGNVASARRPAAKVAGKPLKIAGDPITGPRRGAAAQARPTSKSKKTLKGKR